MSYMQRLSMLFFITISGFSYSVQDNSRNSIYWSIFNMLNIFGKQSNNPEKMNIYDDVYFLSNKYFLEADWFGRQVFKVFSCSENQDDIIYGSSLSELDQALEFAPQEAKDLLADLLNSRCKGERTALFIGDATGKTTLAKGISYLAYHLGGWGFIVYHGSDFGRSNNQGYLPIYGLRDALDGHCKRGEKIIVIIDEIDVAFESGKMNKYDIDYADNVLSSFLDHQRYNKNFFLIATAKNFTKIPKLFRNRAIDNLVMLPELNNQAIKDILKIKLDWSKSIMGVLVCDDDYLKHLAERINNFSIRRVDKLLNKAEQIARRSNPQSDEPVWIKKEHFEEALCWINLYLDV
ncbi:MAG TPA: AAA family ATPase [Candidatus Dependentiae bacterium]|nr:AAA family ATPase [Candidatus Dependentiae bacterium]HRQ62743.1 AAA family ATPase [Candidatus Dependentiae bacterium]